MNLCCWKIPTRNNLPTIKILNLVPALPSVNHLKLPKTWLWLNICWSPKKLYKTSMHANGDISKSQILKWRRTLGAISVAYTSRKTCSSASSWHVTTWVILKSLVGARSDAQWLCMMCSHCAPKAKLKFSTFQLLAVVSNGGLLQCITIFGPRYVTYWPVIFIFFCQFYQKVTKFSLSLQ
jgi:hypothetical protein